MEKKYITVGTLNRYLKNKFDTDPNIQRVCLKGEISNFKGHTRGHLYFTLKDEESRINAVMFSFNASKLTFVPEDGMKVLVEGKVSIYPPTGAYQIYVEEMTNGGSIEDLWAFNEVVVAEAIYNSRIPVISAVGHEIDFTIADFVADLRAPTPTGAAEMAVPNMSDLNTLLDQYKIRFTNKIRSKLDNYKDKLNIIKNSYVLTNPLAVYELKEQKLTNLIDNMNSIIEKKLEQNASRLNMLKNNYLLNHPEELLKTSKHKLSLIINKLELLNPLSILSKGYSIVKKDNLIIKDAVNLNENDKINIKLYNGEIDAVVKKVGK